MADSWTSPYSDVWRSMLLLLFHGIILNMILYEFVYV